jgi:hypothetical protein
MSDITAVVLSIGEPYTDRAIASVQHQTLPVAETVVVRGVSPFHHALNQGAAQVRTPFFVQVDADMILDATCIEALRSRIDDGLGLVSAHLRDAVIGRAQGIRLYRTQCFEQVQIGDTISPDLDFTTDIQRHGWGRLYTLRYADRRDQWHTLGDHRPDYTPQYTFGKFLLEGVRSRYRRHEGRVRRIFRQLRASPHGAATIALIAAAHGLFLLEQRDLLVPYQRTAEFELLEAFLAARGDAQRAAAPADGADGDLRGRFARAYEHGFRCRQAGASPMFLARLGHLKQQNGLGAWVTLVAMCHGLFHREGNGAAADEAYASLAEILAEGAPW